MKAQNLQQAVSRTATQAATIRFSDAEGKVLTWMAPQKKLVWRATFVTILVVLVTCWAAATVVLALRDR